MTMQIREATIDDAQRILELGRILHAESYYSDYSLDQSRAKAAINDILAYPKQASLLLAENNQGVIIGMLAVRMGTMFYFNRPVAQEQMFYVHPEWRGSSAAIKLIMAFRQWSMNRGANEIMISINAGIGLEQLPRLMQRLGFSHVGHSFALRLEQR